MPELSTVTTQIKSHKATYLKKKIIPILILQSWGTSREKQLDSFSKTSSADWDVPWYDQKNSLHKGYHCSCWHVVGAYKGVWWEKRICTDDSKCKGPSAWESLKCSRNNKQIG